MSNAVAIVTDSSACIPRRLIERYGITIVPIQVAVGGADECLPMRVSRR